MERVTASHLSHVQQVDLQEEAESTSCDLVGRSADGVAQLVADGQGAPLALRKDREERLINGKQNCPRSLQNQLVSGLPSCSKQAYTQSQCFNTTTRHLIDSKLSTLILDECLSNCHRRGQ